MATADLGAHGVSTVGPIPSGLPGLQLPDVHPSTLKELALPTVAVVGER